VVTINFEDICKYIPFPYGTAAKMAWKAVPSGQQDAFLLKVNEMVSQGADPEKQEKLINDCVDRLVQTFSLLEPQKARLRDALKTVAKKCMEKMAH
jgi:hypothetical protein